LDSRLRAEKSQPAYEMPAKYSEIEKRLWAAADQLRANSKLKPSEYSVPVLGLIFLRFAEYRILHCAAQREKVASGFRMCLPEVARFSRLVKLPKTEDIGQAIDDAMHAVEAANQQLKEVLPKNYHRLDSDILVALIENFQAIPMDIEGDAFGKIYEYFLGNFAMSEGQKGGEFFTPTSIVKLIVEIIEPYHGRIFDPACGSGGMFVQSASFVEKRNHNPSAEISIFGQDKIAETVRLCKLNLAVHGLVGDIRHCNTYYEDVHSSTGKFDFVMANPPFNVDKVDKQRLKDDSRFPFGLPRVDNANYLWIQLIYSALNDTGRAGFVMANSASDTLLSEQQIRRQLILSGAVDVMIVVGPYFFYTVRLPCTLWFLDRAKVRTPRREKVLFIEARHIFHQSDRAHRQFNPAQIEFLTNIVRMYRGEELATGKGGEEMLHKMFPEGVYTDVPGLCKVATLAEIEAQSWSLNPGRYVGVAKTEEEDFDFAERLEDLNEELVKLNALALDFQERIAESVAKLLEKNAGV